VVIDTRSDHRSVELTDGVRLGSAGGNGLVGMLLDCVPDGTNGGPYLSRFWSSCRLRHPYAVQRMRAALTRFNGH
jgi:hypothetical protein